MPAAGDACPACGAGVLAPWRTVPTFDDRSSSGAYDLHRCDACGTAVTIGRRESEPALYRGGSYARPRARVDRAIEPLRRLGDRSTLAALGAVPAGTRVLDLGAGDGRLLTLLRDRGCVVRGVEPFGETAAGLPVSRTRLDETAIEPESADVVVLWHVLEHLDDPESAVERARRALRPGGRLVVSVPVLDSLQARIGGTRWFHLDVPRHAVHFTRAGLTRLLDRCGLRVERKGNAVIDQNLLGMTQTLLNRLTRERNVAFRALKGDRSGAAGMLVSGLAALPAAVGGSLTETGAMLAGRAGVVVVHAVRDA